MEYKNLFGEELLTNPDGVIWAKKFKSLIERDIRTIDDTGALESWFCNAIMTGYDSAKKELRQNSNGNIDRPSHYQGVECLNAIAASLTDEELSGFIKGNVIKYVWREKNKNGIEDLKKARWYLNWYIERLENAISKTSL